MRTYIGMIKKYLKKTWLDLKINELKKLTNENSIFQTKPL